MYQKIIFKNSINGQQLEIPLKPGVNLIVGPRGGGKSSLLELLAGASVNLESKKVKSVFKGTLDMPFQFQKIIQDSNEEIDAQFLNVTSNADAKVHYDQRMNIIAQNDVTKTNLIDTTVIEKVKREVALEIVSEGQYIDLYDKFNNLKSIFAKIHTAYVSKQIYWKNVFHISDPYDKKNIFISLNYDNNYTRQTALQWLHRLDHFKKALEQSTYEFKTFDNFLRDYNPFSKTIKAVFNQESQTIAAATQKIINSINLEIRSINQFIDLSDIFVKKYLQIVDELKKSDEEDNKVKAFQIQSLDHMRDMARLLKKMEQQFLRIFTEKWSIDNQYSKPKDLLEYKLEGQVQFDDDQKITLLESLLYKSNTATEPVKWLDQFLAKGSKEIKSNTFQRALAKIVEQKITVYANNKIYEHMSPGEKSIFGIKYKLTKSKDNILFLDQPEDNLDNNTIAHQMLDLINHHPANQVILVTHNANIGILTKPSNVIIANIDDKAAPYVVGDIPQLNDDPKAFYLEGGSEYLIKRYKELIKNHTSEVSNDH